MHSKQNDYRGTLIFLNEIINCSKPHIHSKDQGAKLHMGLDYVLYAGVIRFFPSEFSFVEAVGTYPQCDMCIWLIFILATEWMASIGLQYTSCIMPSKRITCTYWSSTYIITIIGYHWVFTLKITMLLGHVVSGVNLMRMTKKKKNNITSHTLLRSTWVHQQTTELGDKPTNEYRLNLKITNLLI